MRHKFKYLIALISLSTVIILILTINPGPAFLYQNAKGDCSGRSQFLYHKIYKSSDSPDVVFFGSSRTMNGVNDSLLNEGGKKQFLNLGYCRYGRNLDVYFAKIYTYSHTPKTIVIEVREEEGGQAHPITPFLIPASGPAEEAFLFQTEFVSHYYNKFLCNLKYFRKVLWNQNFEILNTTQSNYGFWPRRESIKLKELIKKRVQDSIHVLKQKTEAESMNRSSAFYLGELTQLCNLKNIKLYFLFLPSYGNLNKTPLHRKEYLKMGELLVPPDSIVLNGLNFSDNDHLNQPGAQRLSKWLAAQLR